MTHVATVFLTGASGFLGRHVAEAFTSRGWRVLALAHRGVVPHGAEAVVGDLARPETYADALVAANAVCHLAVHRPKVPPSTDEADLCVAVNALATLRLATAVAAGQTARFVYFSAGNAYAWSDEPRSEDDALYPSGSHSFYLASKLLGEIYVEHVRRTNGLAAVSLRISSPYGPGMPNGSAVAAFCRAARRGEPLLVRGGGRPTADLVYVKDVAAITVAASGGGQPGVYNIGSGRATRILDLAAAVVRASGRADLRIELQDDGALDLGYPALDVTKARREWGFDPQSIDAGLAATIAHLP